MIINKLDIKSPYITTMGIERMVTRNGIAILPVNATSTFAHRRSVFRMAQYFGRECNSTTLYGWNGHEDDMDATAYLWVCMHLMDQGKVPCVGGCCFRQREEGGPALQWIWINPFVRRQGILSESWEVFEYNHPNFAVERPLSESMLQFLEKRGYKNGICGWYLKFFSKQTG